MPSPNKISRREKKLRQSMGKPDFSREDLYDWLCVNGSGEYVMGFDSRAEAKAYCDVMGDDLYVISFESAVNSGFPPTWRHNWNYSPKYDIPDGMFDDWETGR